MFHRFVRLAIALAVLCAPATSHAQCAGIPFHCPDWYRHVIPADGETIPANLPKLAVRAFVPNSPYATLYREDGGTVSFSLDNGGADGEWLIPSELEPGVRYLFRVPSNDCDDPRKGDLDAGYVIESWIGAPSAPLPTELGTVSIELPESGYVSVNTGSGGDACGPLFIPGQFFHLAIAPSESLKPWLAVTDWTVFVDSQRQSSNLETGALLADGGVVPLRGPDTEVSRSPFTAEFACEEPGYHRVQLLAHVLGTNATVGTDVMTVFVDCPDVENDGGAGPLQGIPRDGDRACGCAMTGFVPLAAWVFLIAALRLRRSRPVAP